MLDHVNQSMCRHQNTVSPWNSKQGEDQGHCSVHVNLMDRAKAVPGPEPSLALIPSHPIPFLPSLPPPERMLMDCRQRSGQEASNETQREGSDCSLPCRLSTATHSIGLPVLGESMALRSCPHFSQKVSEGSGSLG